MKAIPTDLQVQRADGCVAVAVWNDTTNAWDGIVVAGPGASVEAKAYLQGATKIPGERTGAIMPDAWSQTSNLHGGPCWLPSSLFACLRIAEQGQGVPVGTVRLGLGWSPVSSADIGGRQ